MKKLLNIISCWEMQIKTVLRYHFMRARVAGTKKVDDVLLKIWRNCNPHALSVGM
jgi:hypothetical protein